MNARVVAGAAIAVVLVLIGGGIWWSQQPRAFVFDVELYDLNRLEKPWPEMKVLVNGAEVAVGHSPDVEGPVVRAEGGLGKELSADMLPHIEVQFRYVCGWKPVEVQTLDLPRDDQVASARSAGRNIPINAELKEDGWVDLYTDNRGQPAHTIELAGGTEDVPQDSSQAVRLLQDSRCAEGSVVKLDGKTIGSLPGGSIGKTETTTRFLFDTTAAHCYTYRQVSYVQQSAPMMPGTEVQPEVFALSGSYFYALPDDDVQYFLKQPPDKIVLPENQFVSGLPYLQASLLETSCAGKRNPR